MTTHLKLEELFNGFLEVIDSVAETMLMHGFKPVASLAECLSIAQIKEADDERKSPVEIYEAVLADFEYLYNFTMGLKKSADEEGYYHISTMLDEIISPLAKNNWMLRAELGD